MTALLLRGGVVFDGVSPQRRHASVLIHDGIISEVRSDLSPSEASTVLDIDGAWLTPGFIDPHSHADAAVLTGEQMENRAHSGVTTEIVGQDGLGLAHAKGAAAEHMTELLTPIAGDVTGLLCDGVREYLERVDTGAYARAGTLSPHGTIRASVVGRDLIPANGDQLSAMVSLFLTDMQEGSLGLSTGLSYPPAIASSSEEIATLLSAHGRGTVYVTHLRSYGKDFEGALDEAVEITRQSGCHLHLSHFHVSGPGRASLAGDFLNRLEAMEPSPTLDSYPYPHACTFLTALLPTRLQDLSYQELQRVVQTRKMEIISELADTGPEATISVGWDNLVVSGLVGEKEPLNGLTLTQIGARASSGPEAAVVDIIVGQPRSPMVLVPQGHIDNIRTIASSPWQVVGSDGIFGSGGPHPRLTGTFFRFMKDAMGGNMPLSVESAVSKMTSQTASIFGLNSGVIAPGYPADVLVIDPDHIERGDDVTPSRPSCIQHAFIGGEQTIKSGVWQGRKLSGMAVRGKQ